MAIARGAKIGVMAVAVLAAAGGAAVVLSGGDATTARAGAERSAVLERPQATDDVVMQVWKTPTCVCCGDWVDHMRQAGFQVEAHDVSERELIQIKHRHGIDVHLSSCHTATVDGYAVEGHVPAGDVRRLLAERPDVKGIAVPGMPIGSPGMEIGDRRDPYDVVSFDESGTTRVFSSYRR